MTKLNIHSQNIKNSVSLDQFKADLIQALKGADVLCLQECKEEARHDYIRTLEFGGWSSYLPNDVRQMKSNPIIWKTSRFKLLDSGVELLHKSFLFASATRYATWVTLKDKETGRTYTVVNYHSIPSIERQGAPKISRITGRVYRRHSLVVKSMNVLSSLVVKKRRRGMVFIIGDWNVNLLLDARRRHPDFPFRRMRKVNMKFTWEVAKNYPRTHGKRCIDGLTFLYKRKNLRFVSAKTIGNTRSDHQGTIHVFDVVPVNPPVVDESQPVVLQ